MTRLRSQQLNDLFQTRAQLAAAHANLTAEAIKLRSRLAEQERAMQELERELARNGK
jgi:hypothetical protein